MEVIPRAERYRDGVHGQPLLEWESSVDFGSAIAGMFVRIVGFCAHVFQPPLNGAKRRQSPKDPPLLGRFLDQMMPSP